MNWSRLFTPIGQQLALRPAERLLRQQLDQPPVAGQEMVMHQILVELRTINQQLAWQNDAFTTLLRGRANPS